MTTLTEARQSERAPKSVPPESVVNSGVGCLYTEIRYPNTCIYSVFTTIKLLSYNEV